MTIEVKAFFDKDTSTLTYVVLDPSTRDAVIIDPVWNFDPQTTKASCPSVNEVDAFVKEKALSVHFILETHAHADHLTGAQCLKKRFPKAVVGIGEKIAEVQKSFREKLPPGTPMDGSQFDRLFKDGETFRAGSLGINVLSTPGHTRACLSYVIEGNVFTGDALFMPDGGTGRCDFPGGSSSMLFDSIRKLYALPEDTKTYTGHDYQPNGRALKYQSTIGEQKRSNIHLKATTTKEEYVKFRDERDKTLKEPKLLFPSIQVNLFGGKIPPNVKVLDEAIDD